MMSLSKFIAQAGVCSRRNAVDLIKQGAVTVNGHLIIEPGYKITPQDVVKVNNKVIKQESKVYILINKPRGYVTVSRADDQRKTVMDLIQGHIRGRVYPIGTLDSIATGLLIMTNDGQLAQYISEHAQDVKEVYHITLTTPVKDIDIADIKRGVQLSDGKVVVDSIKRIPNKDNTVIVSMRNVRKRALLRLFESFGYLIKRLNRIEYAGLTNKRLPINEWRFLTPDEVESLSSLPKQQRKNK